MSAPDDIRIRPATEADVKLIFGLILEIAGYEKLAHAVSGDVRLEWCALDWNEPALNFYEKLGATRLDDWRMFRLQRDGMRKLSA